MPNVTIKNLENIRSQNPLLGEALDSIAAQINNANAQTGADPTANQSAAPPPITGFNVTSGGGAFSLQITDNNPVGRQINYFAEYSATPGFQQPHVYPMGPSRTAYLALDNRTLYWRAYSAYPTGPASKPVYHGGANPAPAVGGGSSTGATLQASTGAGTASTNGTQGANGFGPVPYRTSNGLPPKTGARLQGIDQ